MPWQLTAVKSVFLIHYIDTILLTSESVSSVKVAVSCSFDSTGMAGEYETMKGPRFVQNTSIPQPSTPKQSQKQTLGLFAQVQDCELDMASSLEGFGWGLWQGTK